MKKNWFALVSIVLNIVLLAYIVYLGGKLESMEARLENDIQRTEDHIHTSIDHIDRNVKNAIKEATKLVTDYTVEPVAIDAENHTLEMSLRLQLRQWSADTMVDVIVTAGANTHIKRMPIDTTGSCSGNLIFPVEDSGEVKLAAAITTNGVTTREDLGGWSDIAQMLPIQLGGWGGSVPEYREGMLALDSYQVSFDGGGRWGITVKEPEFRVYVNDRLEQTVSAAEMQGEPLVQYEIEMEQLTVPCKPDDTVRLTFVCKDDFGLGYEFNLGIWRVPAEDGNLEELPMEMETRPIVTWE